MSLSASERLGHFGDFEPAQFGRFDLGAVARDPFGELGEADGIARIEVGVRERPFVGGDRSFQRSISPGRRS